MGTDKKKSLFSIYLPAVITAVLIGIGFLIFTVMTVTYDVDAIGPEGSSVGFSKLNAAVRDAVGTNAAAEKISDILGYLAIAVMACFFALGVYRLIKGRSFRVVDREIYAVGGFYAVLLAVYLLFEKLELNYRPVLGEEGLEASYPSSHTVLALCVFLSAGLSYGLFFGEKNRIAGIAVKAAAAVCAVATVVFRFVSGVHWATDIAGGILLSAFLLSVYSPVRSYVVSLPEKTGEKEKKE